MRWTILWLILLSSLSGETIRLIGASQHDKDHIYGRIVRYFGHQVQIHYNEPIEIQFHHKDQDSLGTEADFAILMRRGKLDFSIIAPAHASNVTPEGAFLDTPFLFEDYHHWTRVLESDAFDPISDKVLAKGIRVLGFAGGAERNLFSTIPVRSLKDLDELSIRTMSGPIQKETFLALGMNPRPIPYSNLYDSIVDGVVSAAENESHGVMTHAKIAPHVTLTRHSITVRPLCFSETRFRQLPQDLRKAILKAGRETAEWARTTERFIDTDQFNSLRNEGFIKVSEFPDRSKLFDRVAPVKERYAQQLGLEKVLKRIKELADN